MNASSIRSGIPEPFVSVIVPTYQREKELTDTLSAVLQQPYPKYEVIVVDQTLEHEPATERFLGFVRGRIRYFRLPRPGLCKANNFAAEQAVGDVLLFVDDDIIPAPDLIGHHARSYIDPAIGAVAGRVIDDRGWILDEVPAGKVRKTGEIAGSFSATRPADAETVPGGNVSIRKDVFDRVKGFPPGYIGTEQFGDSDLGCRIRRAGYRIRFEPAAEIFHLRAPAGGCANRVLGPRRDYAFYHNAMLFALRYLPPQGVLTALVLRCYQALRKAWSERQPWQVVLPVVAAAHAAVSAARTR